MEEYSLPTLGSEFPKVCVKTTQGNITLPDYYAGKYFVLFSHPGDFTPVCTTEFVSFQLKTEEFKKLNTKLIGLSIDQVQAHLKWIEWIHENLGVDITFPVIADSLGILAKELGMISPDKGSNTVRAVFIVDDNGIIRQILYYPQEIGRNIDEILRSIKALQINDKYKVATPANWPENELINGNVIIPPASTEEEIKERKKAFDEGKIDCFDWWFCYKQI